MWSENVLGMILFLLNLLRFVFFNQYMVYIGKYSMWLWKKLLECSLSIRPSSFLVFFRSCVSLLISLPLCSTNWYRTQCIDISKHSYGFKIIVLSISSLVLSLFTRYVLKLCSRSCTYLVILSLLGKWIPLTLWNFSLYSLYYFLLWSLSCLLLRVTPAFL